MSRRTIRARCTMRLADRSANGISLASFRAKRIAIRSVDGNLGDHDEARRPDHQPRCAWLAGAHPSRAANLRGRWLRRPDRTLERRADPTTPVPVAPLPPATHERLRQALLALDGSLAGATYRQIAIRIFGEDSVRKDWNAATRFLKDRTRRLVAKGRALMNGGYRDLLR
jgi:T6SS, Transcription factor, DNA binding domain